ncbi:MAG TPA: hypothetical protein VFF06_17560 [Polyangia bacterium]|nr:hypothetical protein [Polyangia bacterium]
MFVPRYTAGLVLDYLELATGEIAVDASAAVESDLPHRVDRARAQLDKAAGHALDDEDYGAWIGAEAFAQFVSTLEAADHALADAQRSPVREQLWKNLHRAVEHLTGALEFSRVIWENLPPESDGPAVETLGEIGEPAERELEA